MYYAGDFCYTFIMKKSVAILIIILALAGIGYWYYKAGMNDGSSVPAEDMNPSPISVPVGLSNVPQEIEWYSYSNAETGIAFHYPPQDNVNEGSYNGQNGAVFYVDVYDPLRSISIFNANLEGAQCPYSGVVGQEVIIASTTFKHTSETYPGNAVYEHYSADKNGGCYRLNLSYKEGDNQGKQIANDILASFTFGF